MNLKVIVLGIGWVLFLGLLVMLGLATFNADIADRLLWRFESLERAPSVSQRVFESRTQRQSLYVEQHLAVGTPVFLGDSHLQLIPAESTRWAANFAIGGQRLKQIIQSVPKFKSLATARTLFVNGGENDLLAGDSVEAVGQHWQKLLTQLQESKIQSKRIVCVGLPEAEPPRINAEKVKLLNHLIADICRKSGGQFLAIQIGAGDFIAESMASDNLHLSRPAMVKLAALMSQADKQP